jgi:hypothetical protein
MPDGEDYRIRFIVLFLFSWEKMNGEAVVPSLKGRQEPMATNQKPVILGALQIDVY